LDTVESSIQTRRKKPKSSKRQPNAIKASSFASVPPLESNSILVSSHPSTAKLAQVHTNDTTNDMDEFHNEFPDEEWNAAAAAAAASPKADSPQPETSLAAKPTTAWWKSRAAMVVVMVAVIVIVVAVSVGVAAGSNTGGFTSTPPSSGMGNAVSPPTNTTLAATDKSTLSPMSPRTAAPTLMVPSQAPQSPTLSPFVSLSSVPTSAPRNNALPPTSPPKTSSNTTVPPPLPPPTVASNNSWRPVSAPSATPTVNATRQYIILDFLQSIGASVSENFNATLKTATPSDRAAQWLITNNTLDPNDNSRDKVRLAERYALATLWFQPNSGIQWKNQSRWLTDAHECEWYGVVCGKAKGIRRAIQDLQNATIDRNPTDPDRPSELPKLRFVSELRLDSNSLVGTIPSDLKLLSSLKIVNLASNNLTGTLPESIGDWIMLKEAYLNNNQLHGTLPSTMSNWTKLCWFWAAGNRLDGSIPDWMQNAWPELNKVDLSSNQLAGMLPAFIGQWSNLELFSVFSNLLNGTIPTTISNWSSIVHVDLHNNNFTGPLPVSIKQWTKIESFNVSGNMLSGAIPTSLGMAWQSIDQASFTDNMFVGSIPAGFCILTDTNHSALEVDCMEVKCSCCTNCNRMKG
jgi:Leucine-rich repeat (LRR) protein